MLLTDILSIKKNNEDIHALNSPLPVSIKHFNCHGAGFHKEDACLHFLCEATKIPDFKLKEGSL